MKTKFDFMAGLQVLLFVLIVGIISAVMADMVVGESYAEQGVVVGREYTPASSRVSSGLDAEGKPIVVTTHVSEKWTLVIRMNDQIGSYEVSPNIYYSFDVGDLAAMKCRKGKILGLVACQVIERQ